MCGLGFLVPTACVTPGHTSRLPLFQSYNMGSHNQHSESDPTVKTWLYSPKLSALDVHVGLTEREGVYVRLVVQVSKAVVDEPMSGLVAPHGVDDVKDLGVRLQPPVVFGDLRGRVIGPSRDTPCLEVLNAPRTIGVFVSCLIYKSCLYAY